MEFSYYNHKIKFLSFNYLVRNVYYKYTEVNYHNLRRKVDTCWDNDSPLIGCHVWGWTILIVHVASIAHLRCVGSTHHLIAFRHTTVHRGLSATQTERKREENRSEKQKACNTNAYFRKNNKPKCWIIALTNDHMRFLSTIKKQLYFIQFLSITQTIKTDHKR